MSVLGNLFSDIANAIRTKTGEIGTMKPADFATKIAGITTGGSNGTTTPTGEWKTRTFTFTPDSDPFTVFHGCGVVPDLIQVYIENNTEFDMNTEFGETFYIEKLSKRFRKFLTNDGSINFYNNNIMFSVSGSEEIGYTLTNMNFTTTGDIESSSGLISLGSENAFTFSGNTNLTYTCVCYWYTGDFDQVIVSGVPDFVKYVTFMNGDAELYKMPFIKNYDCPDPITEGLIETPTKEATVSTIYTYSGWDNDLTDLTEDVIVNATYTESTRYYTVTFYDEDGTTVLNTMQVAYGETPSYTPSKTGYTFNGWTTELVPVTGDITYIATWREMVDFASSDWSAIAAVSQAGKASEYFALGDTREETITKDGTTYTTILKIIGFDHDDKADGSGKAGLSIAVFKYNRSCLVSTILGGYTTFTGDKYGNSNFKNAVDTFKTYFSEDLQNVIVPVIKDMSSMFNTTHSKVSCELFPLSVYESGWNFASQSGIKESDIARWVGTKYAFFDSTNYYGNPNSTLTRVTIYDDEHNATSYISKNFVFRDANGVGASTLYSPYGVPSTSTSILYRGLNQLNSAVCSLAFCV